MVTLNFDANKVEPAKPMEALPEGKYKVAIVGSENKETKDKLGSYLQLKLQVLDGEYKGRSVYDRLNLNNKSTVAVEIARATLSSICHAVGVLTPNDSSQLHNRPMIAKVACKKREDTGGVSNEVKSYEALSSASEGTVATDTAKAPW